MAECCVCFELTDNHVTPCAHVLCKPCAVRWCTKKVDCPLCKATIASPCPVEKLDETDHLTRRVLFSDGDVEMGITIKNVADGVCVKEMKKSGLAAKCGFKIMEVITHLNDIPVAEAGHLNAIRIINACQSMRHPLMVRLQTDVSAHFSARHSALGLARSCRRCIAGLMRVTRIV